MNLKIRRNIIQLAALLCLILLACTTVKAQEVRYNFAPNVDFTSFKTYKWVRIQGAEVPNQILDQQIKQSVDNELAKKGFTKTDDDSADLYVAYQVSVTEQRQWNAYGTGGMGWRMGGGMATMTSSTIHVGTLGLDIYDHTGKQLIWRGSATKTLNPPKDPAKAQKNLDKAVAKLLKNFPPKKK